MVGRPWRDLGLWGEGILRPRSRGASDEGGAALVHGGNLDEARRRFPDAPAPWLDLSTGINPRGYPIGQVPPAAWRRLPDSSALAELETVAARTYRAPLAAEVVAAPGTQALIQTLPRLLPARRVAVLDFGYGEHPAAWRAADAQVAIVSTLAALAEADVAVVVNPNNPDGLLVAPDALLDLAATLAGRGGTLVVDEAFMDVTDPAFSLVPALPKGGAIVLRSFGKFFGLAGIRLGFAITGAELANRLRVALGPWPVSGPAIAVGTPALADTLWQRAEIGRLHEAAARLDALLQRGECSVIGGTALFRLAETPAAPEWFNRLGRAGILVRPFTERPTWLRFGLPDGEPDWERLAAALGVG